MLDQGFVQANCFVVFVSKDPVSWEEYFCHTLSGGIFVKINFCLSGLHIFCHLEATYMDKAGLSLEANLLHLLPSAQTFPLLLGFAV